MAARIGLLYPTAIWNYGSILSAALLFGVAVVRRFALAARGPADSAVGQVEPLSGVFTANRARACPQRARS